VQGTVTDFVRTLAHRNMAVVTRLGGDFFSDRMEQQAKQKPHQANCPMWFCP